MKPYDDEAEFATYMWNHYWRLLRPIESKAGRVVYAQATNDAAVRSILKRYGLADDPAVMAELAGGVEAFRRRVAHRILEEHAHEVFVNRCSRCERIVRTPMAQQCLWCGHDWHPKAMK
jgi:hypothetical protein